MGKLPILLLSFLFLSLFCNGQIVKQTIKKCDCSSKIVTDSLITKYIDNGSDKHHRHYSEFQLYLDSLIAICPLAIAYREKAIPFIMGGDYAKAFPLEDKAVELEPKTYTAYRAFLKCIFTKDYFGAITDFEKAQQLTPDGYEMDHTYFFYMGLCNLELKNYTAAEENFQRDISIQTRGDKGNTPHFNSLLYAGILYFEMKNIVKAKEFLLQCLKAYSNSPDANYYLALTYNLEGDINTKRQYLRAAYEAVSNGYLLNETNEAFTYYPHQITLFEVEKEINNRK